VTSNTHREIPGDGPPPPDEGWWEALFREETRGPRDEAGHAGGWRGSDDGGSPSDWLWARSLYEKDELVDLPVVGFNRGGLLVQAQGMRGFVPLSHVLDLCQAAQAEGAPDLERFVGRTLRLRVIEFDPERGRLVLSERAAQAAPGRRLELLRCLQRGEKVVGLVSNLTAFGAFVDLGGVEGLIHVSELSWGRVRHPADVLHLGERVEAVVLSTDPDLGRIALSLKELRPDPWCTLDSRVRLGDVVEGVVTSVVRFGAFVEIEDGVEGLVHVSELGADSPCDPAAVVHEGDHLRLRVIRFEPSHRKLGLSLRAAETAADSASHTAEPA
jgi:small subunit ribosomal protein S1